jgi:transposase InsO family protein
VALALQDWFSSYGVVPTWVSDQGSHFKNTVIRELNEKLGAEHKFSLPYCPWSNGTIERVNRDTLNVFRALLSEFRILPREWVRLKPLVQMSLNHTAVPSLGNLAPVTVFTGLPASNPLDIVSLAPVVPASTRVTPNKIGECTENLRNSLQNMHKEIGKIGNTTREKRKIGVATNFDVGDYVLVARPLQAGNREKLQAVWKGPMRVINTLSPHVFEVEDLVSNSIHKVHSQRLRFYSDASLEVTHELVTQIKHDGGLFEVERLKEHRFSQKRWELLVQWLGFESVDDTWEPMIQLYADVPTMVKDYLKNISNNKETVKSMVTSIKKKYPSFIIDK